MSADSNDNLAYEPASEHDTEARRRHYWAVAIGLQAVDGLHVSKRLEQVSDAYIRGECTLAQAGAYIRRYHGVGGEASQEDRPSDSFDDVGDGLAGLAGFEDREVLDEGTRQADLVGQRIAELLAASPFYLDQEMLVDIHRYLFQDLDPAVFRPGQLKTERMVKQEEILNGDSVLYADPLAFQGSFNMAFRAEARKSYGCSLTGEDLEGFCHFIAFLWQIHPFAEGNTRTVAVFSELYLNHLGFPVGNEAFQHHSAYYRDALVRAVYRNVAARIEADERFLQGFYDAVVNDAPCDFCRESCVCVELFDNPDLLRNIPPSEALSRLCRD